MTLSPLPTHTKLAPTPKQKPKYSKVIKSLSGKEITCADPAICRVLVALMNMHAVKGGAACHWGGPSALAEINSAIHAHMFKPEENEVWWEKYNFINDVGHAENALYALRSIYQFDDLTFENLKGFRSIESKLTGHGESHLNPEGVLLSNGPLGSALPQAQGLALADKATGKNRTTVCVPLRWSQYGG